MSAARDPIASAVCDRCGLDVAAVGAVCQRLVDEPDLGPGVASICGGIGVQQDPVVAESRELYTHCRKRGILADRLDLAILDVPAARIAIAALLARLDAAERDVTALNATLCEMQEPVARDEEIQRLESRALDAMAQRRRADVERDAALARLDAETARADAAERERDAAAAETAKELRRRRDKVEEFQRDKVAALTRVAELEAEVARLRAPMPCGHPEACVVTSGSGPGATSYCGWCAEVERLKAQLRRICKYAREDRATTPGSTRLARAIDETVAAVLAGEE